MTTRVLVVDDDDFMRRLLVRVLQHGDYQVVGEAAEGAEAIRLYALRRPDIVLLDLAMPGVDGFTALQEIMTFDPGAVVVVCSGLTMAWAVE